MQLLVMTVKIFHLPTIEQLLAKAIFVLRFIRIVKDKI